MKVKLTLLLLPFFLIKAHSLALPNFLNLMVLLDDVDDFEDGEGPAEPPATPIDDHLLFLVIVGVLFALFVFYNQRRITQNSFKQTK